MLDEYIARAKKYCARTATGFTHAATEIGQILIGIDNVALRGLTRHLIITTVIESHPLTPKTLGTRDLGPPDGGVGRHRAAIY